MRKLFIPLLLLLCCALPALAEDYTLMAETETRQLYVSVKGDAARIVDKKTGQAFETAILNGQQGNKAVKNIQKSAVNITYIANEKTATVASMDTYSLGVDMDGYEIVPIENGFEIRYSVGDTALTIDDLPKMVPIAKYSERIKPFLTDKEDKTFRDNYRIVGNDWLVRTKDSALGTLVIKQLYNILYTTSQYTLEDRDEDNATYGYEIENFNPRVDLTVRFTLSADDLIVTLPVSSIETTEGNAVQMLELLPYFMTGTQADSGYILVPDGSGSLIYLNSGKTTATSFQTSVYGTDILKNANKYVSPRVNTMFPVYGIKAGDRAVFAIIEKGAEIADIYADISGRSDEFNRVTARFTLLDIESVSLVGNDSVTTPRYPDDLYEGDLQIRYKFLFGEDADYVGMADAYRDYLIENGSLAYRASEESAPLFIEMIGAVRKQKFFLGVPYDSTVQATTIAQAKEIYELLREEGARNVKLIFNGLFSGGVKHSSLTSVALDGGMGGKKALSELSAALSGNNDTLFPAVNMGKVYGNRNFNAYTQAARKHDGETASVVTFGEPVLKRMFMYYNSYYVSAHYLSEYVQKSLKALDSWGFSGLNVMDLASVLTPDYRRNENISRIHATETYREAIAALAEKYPLMLDLPNDYALSGASYVTNLPSSDNGFKVEDAAIPFVQLVLRGCAGYSCESWNTRSYLGMRSQLLYALESGSAPRFTLTYADSTIFTDLQDVELEKYFSTKYDPWAYTAAEIYLEYDAFYQKVKDAKVTGHEILTNDVRAVTFDNGVTLYVNYGAGEWTGEDVTVPGEGYLVKGGM